MSWSIFTIGGVQPPFLMPQFSQSSDPLGWSSFAPLAPQVL
jgi:hypothetical protein